MWAWRNFASSRRGQAWKSTITGIKYQGKKCRSARLGINVGRLEVLEAHMRLLEATTQAQERRSRAIPAAEQGRVHEALTAPKRTQSDEVHRRLEWLALLD